MRAVRRTEAGSCEGREQRRLQCRGWTRLRCDGPLDSTSRSDGWVKEGGREGRREGGKEGGRECSPCGVRGLRAA